MFFVSQSTSVRGQRWCTVERQHVAAANPGLWILFSASHGGKRVSRPALSWAFPICLIKIMSNATDSQTVPHSQKCPLTCSCCSPCSMNTVEPTCSCCRCKICDFMIVRVHLWAFYKCNYISCENYKSAYCLKLFANTLHNSSKGLW